MTDFAPRGLTEGVSRHRAIKVVGVTFTPNYPQNLIRLREIAEPAEARGEYLTAILRRNPANPHDANAVEVHVPALGDLGMVGHVPADQAARLAPRMDAGERFAAAVFWVRIDPSAPANPGLSIIVRTVTS